MGIGEIDERMRAAILRLTTAERECLKRCLRHQTAKQMALDLGISPHAVEKRLKMARAKLGLSSSLEAARLVEALERSGRLVPGSSDLPSGDGGVDVVGSAAAPRNETAWIAQRPQLYVVSGAMLMSLFAAAAALLIWVQPTGAIEGQAAPSASIPPASVVAPATVPNPGTEAILRRLVAGFASGAPDYSQLSSRFAETVRRDLPVTQPWFKSLGALKSVTFTGRGTAGDGYYLVFANGEVIMSVALDGEGKMIGGILRPGDKAGSSSPTAQATKPTLGTEAALRRLVAGLASGAPDYASLSPQFAEVVRRDLPMTQPWFNSLGELKSMTFLERGPRGDDAYSLVFAKGEVTMSAALDAEGRMAGGILRPSGKPAGR